jgi:exo-beta-1,3-glucanase (GH17 family)
MYCHYSDQVVDAAWNNGLGVHALIWFGFDGSDQWMTRRDELFSSLHSNPKAKFVTRALQFGSEPLYDSVLSVADLAAQVVAAKAALSDLQIPVTISEMAYGYQKNGGAPNLMSVLDLIDAHMLPFFSTQASTCTPVPICAIVLTDLFLYSFTANQAWPIVLTDLDWFINNGLGKKIWLTENGWPSVTSPSVQPNSPKAVADVPNEQVRWLLSRLTSYLTSFLFF